ncbi:MAG: hypothetical protein AAF541_04620 [Pseudomonadota bacterium]
MINCTCIVQEGQHPDQSKAKLQRTLNHFTKTAFAEEAQIAWIPVAGGNGFTAGEPSTSSIVSITANAPLTTDRRESLLRELVEIWTDEVRCSVDEIVAVIADPQQN